MTEGARVGGCGCNNYSNTAATVLNVCTNNDKKRSKAEIRSKSKTKIAATPENNEQEKVKSGIVIKEDVQIIAENQQ